MNEAFSAIIHDLKNPIGNVKAIHHLLVEELAPNTSERCRTMLEMLQLSCNNAEQLVQQLMEVAATGRQSLQVQLQAAEMNQCLREVTRYYGVRAAEQGLHFQQQLSEEVLWTQLDPARFGRIIDNLFANALKFTPAPGTIQLITRRLHATVQVVVADTGVGIPKELMFILFDEFTPAARLGLHGEASYGMGLSLVHRFVMLHGGTIEVSSTVGQGTQFMIHLPWIEPEEPPDPNITLPP